MLSHTWPESHVSVINRGIGGQDAAEELPRLHPDAIAAKPQLVIWQVGANGALRDTDLRVFRKLLMAGLAQLGDANTDIILMDNQRAPALLATQDDNQIDRALADLAKQTHVSLFSRSLLMDEWREKGAPYKDFIAVDGLHHNDFGYRCVAQALGASIVKEIGPVVVDKSKLWR
jgi:acyl-CoA thioesterase-1